MRRKTTQVMMLSLLLTGAATVFGGYAYASDDDDDETTTVDYRPYKPSNISYSLGDQNDDGSATVTLTFTTPSQSYDTYYGALDKDKYPLTEITKIVVAEREADEWGFDYVYTTVAEVTEGIKIGEEMSIELANQAEGKHTYFVIALNSASPAAISKSVSSSSVNIDVTIGTVYEAPAAVTDLKYTNDNAVITLSWTAPEKGKNGGQFKASELVYDVYRNDEKIASDLTETTYTDNLTSLTEPTSIYYSVVAKTSKGSSSKTSTDYFIEGPAYNIPFTETFKNGSAQHLWTKETTTSYLSISTYITSSTSTGVTTNKITNSYDSDNGAVYIKQNGYYFDYYDEGEEDVEGTATYTSASISLKDAKRPVLSFYQYIAPSAKNELKGAVSVEQGGVTTVLKEYTYTDGTEGWRAESIDLSKFIGDDIKLIFSGSALSSAYGFTAFDVITVEEANDYDLVLNSFNVPSSLNAGDEYTASIDVYNKGLKDAENFTVELLVNGTLLKSEKVESLAPGASQTVNFTATATNDYGTSAKFEANINFESDEVTDNNSASASATIKTAAAPAVTKLTGSKSGNNVTLNWDEPDYILPASQKVTESFEDYANAATSFGSWTMSASHYYGPDFSDWDIDEDAFASRATFTVLDSETLDASDTWYGHATTGTHYLMNTGSYYGTRTDWLFSPVLSGAAQTVTFNIASRHTVVGSWTETESPDHVKVYYSTTTNDKNDFKTTVVDTDITSVLKNGDDFQTISAELPEGAKYFAIVISNSGDEDGESIVFIDDIQFEQGTDGIQAELIGYDVYDGDVKLNDQVITEKTYSLTETSSEDHVYTVVAVYNVGDSEKSNAAKFTSGVNSVETSATATVVAGVGEIHINAAAAQVFDLAGRLVANVRGESVVSVANGTYIVRADNATFKVLVK
jgi:hypothetical protein